MKISQSYSRHGIHRNLNPNQIFLHSRVEPVIGGLALAKIGGDPVPIPTNIESAMFIAPELLNSDESYDCSVDVFAFTVLICTLFDLPTQLDDGKVFP
jgi:serine/threonine protein kinase